MCNIASLLSVARVTFDHGSLIALFNCARFESFLQRLFSSSAALKPVVALLFSADRPHHDDLNSSYDLLFVCHSLAHPNTSFSQPFNCSPKPNCPPVFAPTRRCHGYVVTVPSPFHLQLLDDCRFCYFTKSDPFILSRFAILHFNCF
jgi:hypothetical protein